MKLPAIPFLSKKEQYDYFIALLFDPDKVSAILFQGKDNLLNILAHHETKMSLEESTVEDLVVACDTVISRLEVSLPEDTVVEKTIFSVPYSWVEEGKIKSHRLTELKKISTELALVPMGFIVSIEAIVVFLQKKEGAPLSGIFVEISEKIVTVYLVRKGLVIDVRQGEIYEGVEKTVERLLEKAQLDVLPSKIILLNTKEAESVQQKFLSHHWTKEIPFMHLPQVAVLEKGFENEAIVNGVAAQMGAQVTGEIKASQVEEAGDDEEMAIPTNDTFGFVKDADVATFKEEKKEEMREESIVNIGPPKFKEYDDENADGEEIFEEDVVPERNTLRKKPFLGGGILGIVSSIPKKLTLPFLSIGKFSGGGRQILIPVIAGLVVIIFVALYYTVFTKADVTLFTDQKAFKDALDITLTTNGESSFSDKKLKISTVNEEVSGEETQETTGKKETGQKAKGEVTVFNKTEQSQVLDKGTTVVSSNGLEYTLADKIQIASTSSFSTSFSSQNVKVEAAKFGKEYNIPSGINFTVKSVSSTQLIAKNDIAFSGGTKEEIQIVSDKDLSDLATTVTNRLFDKAKSQAQTKLGSGDALIPVIISSDFKDETYDKKVNDQAKNVKLTATVTYTIGVYKKEELEKFLATSSNFSVPSDFKLSDKETEIKITDLKENKNDITAKLSFNAIFKPELTLNEIPKKIKGKTKKSAEVTLKAISGVSDVNVKILHGLPVLPQLIPFNEKNISVNVKTQ